MLKPSQKMREVSIQNSSSSRVMSWRENSTSAPPELFHALPSPWGATKIVLPADRLHSP